MQTTLIKYRSQRTMIPFRWILIISALFILGSSARAEGIIVLANDEWILSNVGFGSTSYARVYALNVASFLAPKGGKFLCYSDNFGLTGSILDSTLRNAGYHWRVSTVLPFTLDTLLSFDAVWLAGFPPAPIHPCSQHMSSEVARSTCAGAPIPTGNGRPTHGIDSSGSLVSPFGGTQQCFRKLGRTRLTSHSGRGPTVIPPARQRDSGLSRRYPGYRAHSERWRVSVCRPYRSDYVHRSHAL